LDEILIEREQINAVVRDIIDQGTDAWGIEVTAVEVKDIDLPQEMKRAMAKQAEAERERRGKVIAAAGEAQAAVKLAEAAKLIQDYPVAIQLRFLQTAVEIAAENNSTMVFPVPMDLFKPIVEAGERFKMLGALPPVPPSEPSNTLGAETAPEALSAGAGDALPEGVDPTMLTDAAKALLGLVSGGSPSEEPAVPASASEGDEDPGE
jgi:hypothetical protein